MGDQVSAASAIRNGYDNLGWHVLPAEICRTSEIKGETNLRNKFQNSRFRFRNKKWRRCRSGWGTSRLFNLILSTNKWWIWRLSLTLSPKLLRLTKLEDDVICHSLVDGTSCMQVTNQTFNGIHACKSRFSFFEIGRYGSAWFNF